MSECSCCEWYLGSWSFLGTGGHLSWLWRWGLVQWFAHRSWGINGLRRIFWGVSFGFVLLEAWGQRNSELSKSIFGLHNWWKISGPLYYPGLPWHSYSQAEACHQSWLRYPLCLLLADHRTLLIHTFSLWLLGRVNEMWCTKHSTRCLAQSRHGTNNNSYNF